MDAQAHPQLPNCENEPARVHYREQGIQTARDDQHSKTILSLEDRLRSTSSERDNLQAQVASLQRENARIQADLVYRSERRSSELRSYRLERQDVAEDVQSAVNALHSLDTALTAVQRRMGSGGAERRNVHPSHSELGTVHGAVKGAKPPAAKEKGVGGGNTWCT